MSRRWNRPIVALLLVLSLVLGSGCTVEDTTVTQFDARTYVSGLLGQTYKGTWDAVYLDLVEQTSAQAQKAYETSLAAEYRRFCYQFDIRDTYLDDDTREDIMDLLEELSAKAYYVVQTVAELDDTRYAVEVEVRPIDLLVQVRTDTLPAFQQTFEAYYEGADLSDMSVASQKVFWERYEETWATGIVELCRAKLSAVTYQSPQRILVIIGPDDAGRYGISDNDFANLSTLILPY